MFASCISLTRLQLRRSVHRPYRYCAYLSLMKEMPADNTFNPEQEAAYVLGMMDMYHHDEEIAGMLRMKGLTKDQVDKVVSLVKQEGYEKRVRQAKRILVSGILIAVITGGVWLYLTSKGVYDENGDFLERVNGRMMTDPFLYGCMFGILQTVVGVQRFISYSAKLKKIKQGV